MTDGNRYRKNNRTKGRFHSDWCSMIYPRLLIARSLLTEDEVIFISIDDNEVHNLRKICDEVFGEGNFVGQITRKQSSGSKNDTGNNKVITSADYILIYRKYFFEFNPIFVRNTKKFSRKDNEGNYSLRVLEKQGGGDTLPERPNMGYSVYYNEKTNDVKLLFDYNLNNSPVYEPKNEELLKKGYVCYRPQPRGSGDMALGIWRWGDGTFMENFNANIVHFENGRIYAKERETEYLEKYPESILLDYINTQGTNDLKNIFDDKVFDFPKPINLMKFLIEIGSNRDSLILDFFSGSATTAHAVMQLNAEDGGKRKYICIQLEEATSEGSQARESGYASIPEIAKERIRRAGQKIKAEAPLTTQNLDIGFRVLRLDDSNFNEVNRHPNEYDQRQLDLFATNIKEDRNDLDLLFGAMLSWGVPLSLPISTEEIDGCRIYNVNDGDLIACFAENVNEAVVKAMASKVSLRVLFRDSCFSEDKHKINIFEIFKQQLGWDEKEAMDKIRVI